MNGTASPYVQTVLGPVPPAELGRVLHHEHLLSLTPGPWLSGGRVTPGEDQVARAVEALLELSSTGIGTVVDLSPYGTVGRSSDGANVTLLQEISRRSGIHVVAGTAVYLEAFGPPWTVSASVKQMTSRFVADAQSGIGATGVRAGILGEQATSLNEITAHERKCLTAAARAQAITGLALVTHTTHGTMALEQIDLLREEGADLNRVAIGHMDTHPDTGYVREVARRGVHIAIDTIGKQSWDFRTSPEPAAPPDGEFHKRAYRRSDLTRARRVADLIDAGFLDRILLAHDLTGEEVFMNPGTHGQWGYNYLNAKFSTQLADFGVSAADLDVMMRTNPTRLLTIGPAD